MSNNNKVLYVANNDAEVIGVVGGFKSLIWSNRYYKVGDFEIYVPYTLKNKNLFKQDNFIWREKDVVDGKVKSPKIIEKVEIVSNSKEAYLLITGRDASSVLDRRIIYPTEILNGDLDTCIYTLIDKCLINPTDSKRKVATIDTSARGIITEEINTQVTGDNLLDYIQEVCNDYKVGFRMDLVIETRRWLFSLYKGDVHTGIDNAVVFSKEYKNLIKAEYVNDKEKYKNMAIVAGEGEGDARKIVKINDDLEGLERRELWVDAKDLQSTDISAADYLKQLEQRGSEKLSENSMQITNGGEIDPNTNFIFNQNYFLGDIVIVDGFERVEERIVETTESITATGIKTELAFEEDSND